MEDGNDTEHRVETPPSVDLSTCIWIFPLSITPEGQRKHPRHDSHPWVCATTEKHEASRTHVKRNVLSAAGSFTSRQRITTAEEDVANKLSRALGKDRGIIPGCGVLCNLVSPVSFIKASAIYKEEHTYAS